MSYLFKELFSVNRLKENVKTSVFWYRGVRRNERKLTLWNALPISHLNN